MIDGEIYLIHQENPKYIEALDASYEMCEITPSLITEVAAKINNA